VQGLLSFVLPRVAGRRCRMAADSGARPFEFHFEPEPEQTLMQDFLDLRALRDIGFTHETVQAVLARPRPGDACLARVVEIQRERVVVHDGMRAQEALAWPPLRLALELERDALVVGDWVWWRAADATAPGGRGWVLERLAARNRLSRRDPSGARQGLVANIDAALLVMGLDRDFNLLRLDRFLVLARSAQACPVVVLTKADGCADVDASIASVRAHVGPHANVCAVDARAATAAHALAPWLVRGSTLVMLGSSGAGKTTLANTLAGGAGVTHEVRASDGRGQHTTTARTLHRTPSGACLIDTPGLRQLWLDADAQSLRAAFPEVGALAARCRYRDCQHAREPGCAVREGVPAARLKSFQKLLRESLRDEFDVHDRRRQLSAYKQRARENRQRQQGWVPQ